jgi:hypothetical protein
VKTKAPLEEIRQEQAQLSFTLPYRVAVVDGKIKEYNQISEEVSRWLNKVCSLYCVSDAATRSEIRGLFSSDDHLWHLFMFVNRIQRQMAASCDAGSFKTALIALSIENGRFDPRDFILELNGLLRAAKNVGIEAASPLREVAELSSPSTRELLLSAVR